MLRSVDPKLFINENVERQTRSFCRRLKLEEGKESHLAKFQRHSVRRRECQIP